MPKECTHKEYIPAHFGEPFIDDCGESHNVWVEARSVSTYADIDLHRYMCTQCGKVFYYSKAAEDFYEHGIESDRFKRDFLCQK